MSETFNTAINTPKTVFDINFIKQDIQNHIRPKVFRQSSHYFGVGAKTAHNGRKQVIHIVNRETGNTICNNKVNIVEEVKLPSPVNVCKNCYKLYSLFNGDKEQ